jgi:hypothetical protein
LSGFFKGETLINMVNKSKKNIKKTEILNECFPFFYFFALLNSCNSPFFLKGL